MDGNINLLSDPETSFARLPHARAFRCVQLFSPLIADTVSFPSWTIERPHGREPVQAHREETYRASAFRRIKTVPVARGLLFRISPKIRIVKIEKHHSPAAVALFPCDRAFDVAVAAANRPRTVRTDYSIRGDERIETMRGQYFKVRRFPCPVPEDNATQDNILDTSAPMMKSSGRPATFSPKNSGIRWEPVSLTLQKMRNSKRYGIKIAQTRPPLTCHDGVPLHE